jgi:hypothetical protein
MCLVCVYNNIKKSVKIDKFVNKKLAYKLHS